MIGGLVTVPVLGFTVLPSFLNQGREDHDLGPLDRYPEGEWLIATFPSTPEAGDVSRLTVFVRNNGVSLGTSQPSFTILSNHCVAPRLPGAAERAASREREDEVPAT